MAATILNLDEIASKSDKVLKIGDSEYEMASMSVSDFIEISRNEERLAALGVDAPVSEQFEIFMTMVEKLFPTLSGDTLNNLTLDKMMAIIDFSKEPLEGHDVKKGSVKKQSPTAR